MKTNLEKYNSDLSRVISLGDKMLLGLELRGSKELEARIIEKGKSEESVKEIEKSFEKEYQKWYTESCTVIRQIIPERLAEFEGLYKGDGKRKQINNITYTIQDWLNGVRSALDFHNDKRFDDFVCISMKFRTQLQILESSQLRFESSLFEIKQLVQADLFDSELDAATELLMNGFLRGAGAIAGVVLEKHLSQVCENHNITIKKKNPTIIDFNDPLKDNNVYDIPQWRFIQRLGDIRNLCDHKKDKEPTKEEVEELIQGVEKVSKTTY